MRDPSVIDISKTASQAHLQENLACLNLELTAEDLRTLDDAFPAPYRKQPLEML